MMRAHTESPQRLKITRAKSDSSLRGGSSGCRGEMLMMLVSLLCCVPAAKACLQCDRRVRLLHEDLVLSAPTVVDQIEMKKICDHAYVTYRETSRDRKGVIDPTTLYRARTEYQSEFDRFLKTPHTGSVTFEAIQIMEKGRKILEKHLDAFIRDGLCPNKCGLLNRRVMDCFSCRYKTYICHSPSGQQDCGEYPVQAEEGGQAVLNCFLPWHRLLLGKPEYHYSWAPGVPGAKKLDESDFKALVVTDDSSVVLNQLHVDEQGTYRCSLRRQEEVFYQVTFLLTVSSLPDQTHRPLVTLPSLPHGDKYSPFQPTEGLLVPVIAMVTALSLAASVGLTVVLGMMINQRRAAEELRRRRKEEKNPQRCLE
ncbi:izumo sperm-egg fusion protein 1 isoform X2 [Trachinotus anak]|uniref:izumo sperm-egg fusion protein 1 isoform X2 n=1 Tax=Trachinotus anak TaxID=443729 RepID=UPI0039F1D782